MIGQSCVGSLGRFVEWYASPYSKRKREKQTRQIDSQTKKEIEIDAETKTERAKGKVMYDAERQTISEKA